jgi:hypothetical protein
VLADGRHRYEARKRAGRTDLECGIRPGTMRDAILYACGANGRHGHRPTNADKRHAVTKLLRDEEWGKWSDREIARQCRVSQPFVGQVRTKLTVTDNVISEPPSEPVTGNSSSETPSEPEPTVTWNSPSEAAPSQLSSDDSETPTPTPPATRTYKAKSGKTAQMRVRNIGKSKAASGNSEAPPQPSRSRRPRRGRPSPSGPSGNGTRSSTRRSNPSIKPGAQPPKQNASNSLSSTWRR